MIVQPGAGQMSREPSEQTRRRADQVSRQARVGILRNPNAPPRIPPRRAQLMGRWADLRSSRRPPPPVVDEPDAPVAPAGASALRELSGLDMDMLQAEAAQRETGAPLRSRYGGVWRLDPAQGASDGASDGDVRGAPAPGGPPTGHGSATMGTQTVGPDSAAPETDGPALDWLPLDDPPLDPAAPAEPPAKPRSRRLGALLVAMSALGVGGFWLGVALVVAR